MRIFLLPLLGLLATSAFAAPDATEQPLGAKYLKEYAVSLAAGYCDASTLPPALSAADSPQVEDFGASNEDLHRCQYVHELSATGCMQTGNCSDYESWTQANPAIAPTLPREVFISALKARKTKIGL